MALLTPNTIYSMLGVRIKEKIIPDGTRWKDNAKVSKCGFSAGDLYKRQEKLNGNTGKALHVTIHNTEDIKGTHDDGEQYTRATYNENMGSARVHFYADDTCSWQNLKSGTGMSVNDPIGSAEVGWHAGDGSSSTGGNMTSIGIEIIMNESASHDAQAKDNGARIAAWLLCKHNLPIDALVTHTYWVNKSLGKTFADVDKQCTNLIGGYKWCPAYIFNSYNAATALANWKAFKALVKAYLDDLNGCKKSDNAVSGKTIYRVQIGAFLVKANADNLSAKLKAQGFTNFVLKSGDQYKVQLGAYSNKANAEAMLIRVKASGYDAFITSKTV